jgi:hypothetical protein
MIKKHNINKTDDNSLEWKDFEKLKCTYNNTILNIISKNNAIFHELYNGFFFFFINEWFRW